VSDGLKQRIVGALVLGALGLVLLPLALDFTDAKKIDRTLLISKLPSGQMGLKMLLTLHWYLMLVDCNQSKKTIPAIRV
jgi:cell division septation protein DedD